MAHIKATDSLTSIIQLALVSNLCNPAAIKYLPNAALDLA